MAPSLVALQGRTDEEVAHPFEGCPEDFPDRLGIRPMIASTRDRVAATDFPRNDFMYSSSASPLIEPRSRRVLRLTEIKKPLAIRFGVVVRLTQSTL